MTSAKQAISTAFANGATTGKIAGNRMFIEGNTLYSYGYHFKLAVRLSTSLFWVNDSKYSVTTSRQQSAVKQAILASGNRITNEINNLD